MSGGAATGRTSGWQFILADLALILFLLTLTALPIDGGTGAAASPRGRPPASCGLCAAPADLAPAPSIAPAQALYRPVPDGPGLARWLADQQHDPRATLTIFARYAPGKERAAWDSAEALARDGARSGFAVRTIISADEETDLYASLAYDAPLSAQP
jgi:hypothetical protein